MPFDVIFTARARNNLNTIGLFIAEHNPKASRDTIQTILDHCRKLEEFPNSGRVGQVAETREIVVSGTPYIASYRVKNRRVEIIGIFHAARHPLGRE